MTLLTFLFKMLFFVTKYQFLMTKVPFKILQAISNVKNHSKSVIKWAFITLKYHPKSNFVGILSLKTAF